MKLPSPRTRLLLGIALAGVAGLFAGLGSHTFLFAHGLSYFSNDPLACMNCHVMRDHFDGWQKSSHHAVATCNDCHTPHTFAAKYLSKAENGFWHAKSFTMQDYQEPIMIRPRNVAVLQQNCVLCHKQIVDGIATHPGDRQKMLDCLHCHSDVGHGPVR